jgi:hypothetical protein
MRGRQYEAVWVGSQRAKPLTHAEAARRGTPMQENNKQPLNRKKKKKKKKEEEKGILGTRIELVTSCV